MLAQRCYEVLALLSATRFLQRQSRNLLCSEIDTIDWAFHSIAMPAQYIITVCTMQNSEIAAFSIHYDR